MALPNKTIVFTVTGEMHAIVRLYAKRHKMTRARLMRSLIEQLPGYDEYAIAALPPVASPRRKDRRIK